MFLSVTQSVGYTGEQSAEVFAKFLDRHDIVVVKYDAEWCETCRDVESILKQFSELHPDIYMLKVDIDEFPLVKNWAKIKAIPMVIMYRNGKMREFIYGNQPLEKYEEKLRRALR